MSELHWPLDPALVTSPDEVRIARALYATPLRTDEAGRIRPGLCRSWRADSSFRVWRFECRNARAIASELHRVAALRASPARWLFAGENINAARGSVVVRLPFAWRRFPYALTAIAAAPRGVRGPFRLVSRTSNAIEVRRGAKRLVFRRLGRLQLLRAVRAGRVDEAAIPFGDVGRFRGDAGLRVRRLLAVDLLVFRPPGISHAIRRAYWDTTDRVDYQALVAEGGAPAAYGIATPSASADPAAFRRALGTIETLPPRRVRISVPRAPVLQYGVRLLLAQWREVGLGPVLVSGGAKHDAIFLRDAALYPQPEALLGPLGAFALGPPDRPGGLRSLDAALRTSAVVIPVCWVADARWVSPRLRGWREDVLGSVDYTRVRSPARRPHR